MVRKTSVKFRKTSVRVQYTYYQNTHTLQNPHAHTHYKTHTYTHARTHTHITKQILRDLAGFFYTGAKKFNMTGIFIFEAADKKYRVTRTHCLIQGDTNTLPVPPRPVWKQPYGPNVASHLDDPDAPGYRKKFRCFPQPLYINVETNPHIKFRPLPSTPFPINP